MTGTRQNVPVSHLAGWPEPLFPFFQSHFLHLQLRKFVAF